MQGSAGCLVAGVALLAVLYFLFFLMAMIEPGVAILILILGIFVGAGTLVALIAWIVGGVWNRRS